MPAVHHMVAALQREVETVDAVRAIERNPTLRRLHVAETPSSFVPEKVANGASINE